MISATNPAPRAGGGPEPKPISFGEMWSLLDDYRFESAVHRDLFSQNADDARAMTVAEHHGRREACLEVMMIILTRIAGDDEIKERLRDLAADDAVRAAALDALDNPDKDDAA